MRCFGLAMKPELILQRSIRVGNDAAIAINGSKENQNSWGKHNAECSCECDFGPNYHKAEESSSPSFKADKRVSLY